MAQSATFPAINVPGEGDLFARLTTGQGEIVIKLEEKLAPNTVRNFVGLATGAQTWDDPKTNKPSNQPFYDGLVFHRIVPSMPKQTRPTRRLLVPNWA